ncbi:MAG: hypothetical protein ACOCXM_09230 [Myxococcota bacterium]
MMRWIATLGFVVAVGAPAAGQPAGDGARVLHSADLSWVRLEGAERCITSDDLAMRVEQRMGHPVWRAPGEARLTVEGWIAPSPDGSEGFVAGVAFLDADDQVWHRETLRHDGSDCRELDEALAAHVYRNLRSGMAADDRPEAETGNALATPESDPGFNPYLGHDQAAPEPPRRARSGVFGAPPLPNPYGAHSDARDTAAPHFNPYTGDPGGSPVVRVTLPAPPRSADPAFNPYRGPPPPPDAAGTNPYRP